MPDLLPEITADDILIGLSVLAAYCLLVIPLAVFIGRSLRNGAEQGRDD